MPARKSSYDPLDSPPEYATGQNLHQHPVEKTTKQKRASREYTSVPMDEIAAEDGEESFPPSADFHKLGLSMHRGVFTGRSSRRLDEDNLAAFLIAQKMNPSQQMYTQVTGTFARKYSFQKDSDLQAFSFSVPLPLCHPSQGTLFAFADDLPCLRGANMKIESKEDHMIANGSLPKEWDIAAQSDRQEIYQNNLDICSPATKESVLQAISRSRLMMLPPWLPLGLEWSQLWQEGQVPPTRVADTKAIKRAIGLFLKIKPGSWCRWLIVPQVAYGWDLHLIQDEITKILEQPAVNDLMRRLAPPLSLGQNPLVTISLRVGSVDGGALQPALAIRLYHSRVLATLYKHLRMKKEVSIIVTIVYWLFYLAAYGLSGVSYRDGEISSLLPKILSLGLAPSLVFTTMIIMMPLREAIYSNIGVAWALKSWKSTNLPASLSRQEVLTDLRQNYSSLAQMAEDKIILQRRPEGWYIMAGSREGDWIEANRSIIEKAIKECKVGPLDATSIAELDMVRSRLAQYESDDAVGIS